MNTKNKIAEKSSKYKPPYSISPTILGFVEEIGELLGKVSLIRDINLNPQLRRQNQIRTIQASLEIENNTLTLEQVSAVIDCEWGQDDYSLEIKNLPDASEIKDIIIQEPEEKEKKTVSRIFGKGKSWQKQLSLFDSGGEE
jgi:Fic family protein